MIASFKAFVLLLTASLALLLSAARGASLMENLGRGVVAVRTSATETYVSWRVLGTDPADVAFNLYRSADGAAPVQLNAAPVTGATWFTDATADFGAVNEYSVRPVLGGVEQAVGGAFTLPANAAVRDYLRLPLQRPAGGVTPDGVAFTYSPNDCSVGDLDGDGEYEMVVKWDPSNAKDNSQAGHTGNVLLDAYKLDGTLLWRIDLGRNIRAGAHYTQYLVYDFDGDGKAELVCKTAPNSRDGTGAYVGTNFIGTPSAAINHDADYRNAGGYILTGPEFFTIFAGATGAELATTNYVVPRNANPASGDVTAWGDDYGNRVDRFLACVAYLDGQRPSIVLCRGYYTRAVLVAWDWRDGQLTQRWIADTGQNGTANPLAAWRGQGAHSVTVGDVDGDGRDEITYGAAAFDDDGTGLYSTLLGHGDALHLSKMDPTRPGLQAWMSHESPSSYGAHGLDYRDAATGNLISSFDGNGADVGRGAAGDIDPRYVGYEMWGSRGGLMTASGAAISTSRPGAMNFMIWWDGDLLRETLDDTTIAKWDWTTNTLNPLFSPAGVDSNNGTKATPNLSADLFGDWREEVIWREVSDDALRIYVSTSATAHRLPTLMHDRQYRLAIAWQNVGYNQPPHPGFYLGEGMSAPAQPYDIVTSSAALPVPMPQVVSINRYDPAAGSTGATSVTFRVTFSTPVTGVDAADFTVTSTGGVTGAVSSVVTVTSRAYNVTVSSITGTGTVRLDLKPSGTGITGPGGVPVAGGFTGGQVYARATLAWINPVSGGAWSQAANWDGGVIPDAVGAVPIFGNFDLMADNTVVLDAPRTVSGVTFGDTNPGTAASWTVTDGGNAANTLALDTASGTPVITVGALGTNATATIDAVLTGSRGLTKAGAGTLVLTRPVAVTSSLGVTAGVLRLPTGAAIDATGASGSISSGAQLAVAGGSFTLSGLLTAAGGTLLVADGEASLNGGFRTNADFGSTLLVTGGSVTTPDVNIRRTAAATIDYNVGFVVRGGVANVGTVWLGNHNSTGGMSVEGGEVNATGAITIGNNAGSTRGGGLRMSGGVLNVSDAAYGVVLTRASGNPSVATFTGGVATLEKVTFGFNNTVTAGSGTLTLDGGTLFLGAGGIVRNAAGTYSTSINLIRGVLGAKSDWATSLPVTIGGNLVVAAADAADLPHSITLLGAATGAGSLTKLGGGALTLGGSAVHTYAGATHVHAGILRITGTLGASANDVAVHGGGTIAGNGVVQRAITLNDQGKVAPDGAVFPAVLTTGDTTWNAGGVLAVDLGTAGVSDRWVVNGALSKGEAGVYTLALNATETLAHGDQFTIATFTSTTFAANDFTVTGLPDGFAARPIINDGTTLRVVIIARPVITSGNDAQGVYGSPFAYLVTAVNGPVTFGAANLPPGVSFDPDTGALTGTLNAAGLFLATVSASNEAGTASALLRVIVDKAMVPVTVSGSGGQYPRFTYDGTAQPVTVTTVPAGLATSVTYNGSATVPTLPGTYEVVATIEDPNYGGTVTSQMVIGITALVNRAPQLNGALDGSIQVLTPEGFALNGSSVISGDLLVPGTPPVQLNGHPTLVGIKDAGGLADPTNYTVTLNGSAVVRYVVRQVNPIALPAASAFIGSTGTRQVTLNRASDPLGDPATVRTLTLNGNVGEVALPAGAYAQLTVNGRNTLVLGEAGGSEPAVYHVGALQLNGGGLQVVGPAKLVLANGAALSAGPVGDAAHPEWLTIEVVAGGLTLNGRATLHGHVVAPAGPVILNGSTALHGSVAADTLILNGQSQLVDAP